MKRFIVVEREERTKYTYVDAVDASDAINRVTLDPPEGRRLKLLGRQLPKQVICLDPE